MIFEKKERCVVFFVLIVFIFIATNSYLLKENNTLKSLIGSKELKIQKLEKENSELFLKQDSQKDLKKNENEIEKEKILNSLKNNTSMIQSFSDLGGESFFVPESIVFLEKDLIKIKFEDGHIEGTAYIKFLKNENGIYQFRLIGADL